MLPLLMALDSAGNGVALPPKFDPSAWHLKIVKSDRAIKKLIVGNWVTTETLQSTPMYRTRMCYSRDGTVYTGEGDMPTNGKYAVKDGIIRRGRAPSHDERVARDKGGRYYIFNEYYASIVVSVRSCPQGATFSAIRARAESAQSRPFAQGDDRTHLEHLRLAGYRTGSLRARFDVSDCL